MAMRRWSSMLAVLAALVACVLPSVVSGMVCEWRSPRGHAFNLGQLALEHDFKAQDSISYFSVSVCEVSRSSEQCSAAGGMICEYRVGSNEFMAVIARVPTEAVEPQWRYIDARAPNQGIEMVLRNGDDCRRWNENAREFTNMNRQTVMRFLCAPDANPGYLLSIDDNENSCVSTATFNTRLACEDVDGQAAGQYTNRNEPGQVLPPSNNNNNPNEPPRITPQQPGQPGQPGQPRQPGQPGPPSATQNQQNQQEMVPGEIDGSWGWSFVFYVLVISASYISYGCAWNIYKKGHAELPNAEFWKELPSLVVDGCYFTYYSILRLTQGSSGGAGEYSSIPQSEFGAHDSADQFTT